jgi:phage/plasmid-like protein (TIGR03299 family)
MAFAVTNDLNWTVSKRPLFFTGNDGQPVQWTEKVAVVRDDTDRGLGVVSPNFEVVQNSTLLSLVKPLQEEGLLTLENVGHLQHGARVFAQLKLAQEFEVAGEPYGAFLTLLNGHTGNSSVAVGVTTHRVVCGNSFNLAYDALTEKFRHQAGVNEKVLKSDVVSTYVNTKLHTFSKNLERLQCRRCSTDEFTGAVARVFGRDFKNLKQGDKLVELFKRGRGNEGVSLHDGFQAVTEWTSHFGRKTKKAQFGYVTFGTGNRLNQRAFKVFSELARV